DVLSGGWGGVHRQTLLGEHLERDGIERDFAEAGGVVFPAARIEVHLIDELADCVSSVAYNLGRLAPRRCDHFVADDQEAEISAKGVLFDDDARAFFAGGGVSGNDLFVPAEIRGYAAALIAVLRLDDDGQTDVGGGFPGVGGIFHGAAVGDWNARAGK